MLLLSEVAPHHAASRRTSPHDATCPGPRVPGGLCSEIKEEPGPPAALAGDIRGRGHPVASASAQRLNTSRIAQQFAEGPST